MLFVERNNHAAQLGMIETVVLWCDALNGRAPLRRALSQVAISVNADVALVSKTSTDANGITRLVAADTRHNQSASPVDRSFAHALLKEYVSKAKIGSVWSSRGMDDGPGDDLREFQSRNRLSELVVIPLSADHKELYFLELHFGKPKDGSQQAALNMLTGSLAQTWQSRSAGVFSASLPNIHKQKPANAKSDKPIMSFENPARLSRAEYRVCVQLNRGLSLVEVQKELQIGEATLRTHLRNIYAKTNTSGLPQLLYALLASSPYADDCRVAG